MTDKPVMPRMLARLDVEHTVGHYAMESGVDVALRFIDALELGYEQIGRHPAAGSPRYAHELDLPGLRMWPLRRFPFLIFYVERDDRIDVWRVLHVHRDIPAWLRSQDAVGEGI